MFSKTKNIHEKSSISVHLFNVWLHNDSRILAPASALSLFGSVV